LKGDEEKPSLVVKIERSYWKLVRRSVQERKNKYWQSSWRRPAKVERASANQRVESRDSTR
jgi:hypothetical protein